MKRREYRKYSHGFTLLEISVVLAIIGLILSGGVAVLTANVQARAFNATVARMDAIEKALLDYAVTFNRIPCPANLSLPPTDTNYGIEAANQGTCTGGSPAASFAAVSGTVEGAVPTRALQMPDYYMYDAWGRKFRYAVDPTQTVSNALPYPVAGACTASGSGITVNDASGAARTTTAIYALISHGANGHGAYTSKGAVMNAGSVNADELTNCHCNSSGASTAYAPTYVEKVPMQDANNALDNFDDLVTFKEGWQLQALNYGLSSPRSCLYVTDANNNVVHVYSTAGVSAMQFGSAGSGNGQFLTPHGVVVDASGNLWVTDRGNDRVQKFSRSGNYEGQFSVGGSPVGIAIDSGGNFWVDDGPNNRVLKFNSNGIYLSQIGCASGPCPQGSGNGQFNFPWGVVTDPFGNVWVTDLGNSRVQEFNSSGAYLSQFGSSGAGNGQLNIPTGIAADAFGNIWVVDDGNGRMEKFNSSGVYQSQFGSSGSSNGQFGSAQYVNIDSGGNLWVGDYGNNRVQEFTSSGTWIQTINNSGGVGMAITAGR